MLSNISEIMNRYIDGVQSSQKMRTEKLKYVRSNYVGDFRAKEEKKVDNEFTQCVGVMRDHMVNACAPYFKAAHVAIDKKVNENIPAEFNAKIAALNLAADAGAITPAQIMAVLNDTPQYLAKSAVLVLAHKNNILMDLDYYTPDALHNAVDRVAGNVQQLAALDASETNNLYAALLANDASIAGTCERVNNFAAGNFEQPSMQEILQP